MFNETVTLAMGAVMPETVTVEFVDPPSGMILIPRFEKLETGPGAPEFNTVDATLWLFHAVHQYFLATGDIGFLRDQAFPKLEEIIDWHVKGTRYGICMDAADGSAS